MFKLTYLYHSGFLLESAHAYVVFDFFLDGYTPNSLTTTQGIVPSIGNERSDYKSVAYTELNLTIPNAQTTGVLAQLFPHLDKPCYLLASHFHRDHFSPFLIKFWAYVNEQRRAGQNVPPVHLILSRDIKKYRRKLCNEFIAQGAELTLLTKGDHVDFTKDHLSIEAWGSTDIGCSFLVTLDGVPFFHAGDLNEWHWQERSTPEQIATACQNYQRELTFAQQQLQQQGRKGVAVAIFPCDPQMGAHSLSGLSKWVQQIPTALIVPMHCWEQIPQVQTLFKSEPQLQSCLMHYHKPETVPETGCTLSLALPDGTAEATASNIAATAPATTTTASAITLPQIWLPAFSGDSCALEIKP